MEEDVTRRWQILLVTLLFVLVGGHPPLQAEDAKEREMQKFKDEIKRLKEENSKLKKELSWRKQESVDGVERLRQTQEKLKKTQDELKLAQQALQKMTEQMQHLRTVFASETTGLKAKAEAEQSALREKAEAEQSALREKAKAEQSALREKAEAEQKTLRAKAEAERKALEEKAKAEQSALREKAKAERKALEEKAKAERTLRQREEKSVVQARAKTKEKAQKLQKALVERDRQTAERWAAGLRWAKTLQDKPQQWTDADYWFETACKAGFQAGCASRLLAWYQRGRRLSATDEQAAKGWFQKACKGGHRRACNAALGSTARGSTAGERKVFRVGGVRFAMRWIPAGSFMMGSLYSDPMNQSREQPQHEVRITRGFWMLESEVTQGQYKALMGTNPSHFSSCGDNCPVEQVSRDDARAFANKLSEAQGLPDCAATNRDIFQCEGWRLPTEAEWEYAARAGTTTPFHTGDCISTDQANYNGGYPATGCPKGEYREKTIAVCSLSSNAWGLCDMHGNVWEWVMDVYRSSYTGLPTVDPLRTDKGMGWVLRGGSWDYSARFVRSAIRSFNVSTHRDRALGFRLLRY
jgi:formylglycine-generating enzyme required for sulfatase activity